jgi:hypothetical protein
MAIKAGKMSQVYECYLQVCAASRTYDLVDNKTYSLEKFWLANKTGAIGNVCCAFAVAIQSLLLIASLDDMT